MPEISTLLPHVEALIFASDRPLTTLELTDYVNNALGFLEDRATLDQIEAALNGITEKYALTTASLETLAIIAYKQPVTKGEIEAIRGVSSDYAVQKLLEKELIVIAGRNEKLPGHPLVYATSRSFMDYFGINSSDDLPKIREVLAEQLVAPTIVQDEVITESPANESQED